MTARPRLVILRGLSREAAHSAPFLAALRQVMPDAEIECPDLPGTGTRHTERSPLTVPGITDALRPSSQPEAVHLVGLSLGGMVAADWAARYPATARSLTLVNVSFGRYAAPLQRLRLAESRGALRVLLRWGSAPAREAAILGLVSNRRPDEATLARWLEIQRARPVRLATALAQLAAAARYRGAATPPGLPAQLMVSARDRLVCAACSEALALAWGTPLHRHASAGHDLFLDAPDWCAARVAALVQAAKGACGSARA